MWSQKLKYTVLKVNQSYTAIDGSTAIIGSFFQFVVHCFSRVEQKLEASHTVHIEINLMPGREYTI